MGGFMKGTLVKRLESSKYAFEKTLGRFITSLEDFIRMYGDGDVWISRKLNVEDLLEREDIDTLLEEKEKGNAFHFKSDQFKESFIDDLYTDLGILRELQTLWSSIDYDCKLNYFLDLLKNDKRLSNKIIIFTESAETASYLSDNIKNSLNRNVILFTGSMSDSIKNEIRNNFDPNVDKENVKDDYDVLVTTDVLAEGMNLHRSNVIINYDLPWNPTRIMQRVGRINRVGTKHKEIYVYNFFPTSNSDDINHQSENIIAKIQMFHDILGEDSKFLTDEENISTHELFKRMTTIDADEETGLNSELHYLRIIRDIRDKNPKLFDKIKNLPQKIKVGRTGENTELLTFFRKGYIKKFYLSNDSNCDEINFDSAIKMVETTKDEVSYKINSKYYDLLKKNKKYFEDYENNSNNEFDEVYQRKGKSNANKLILALKDVLKFNDILTIEEIDKCHETIRILQDGELPFKILKEANKLMINNVKSKSDLIAFYKEFVNMIPKTYYETNNNKKDEENVQKEIVLSELFMN